MSNTKTKTTKSSSSPRSRKRSTSRSAKTKARTTSSMNAFMTVNMTYARVALILLALNVLFSGYVLYKLMMTT